MFFIAYLNNVISYFLSFQPYVLLPIIIFILALIFKINVKIAIKSALNLGIGFVGIFMTFDYFVGIIKPVVSSIIERTGLELNILDVGWPPLAAIGWSYKLAPLLIIIFLGINGIMLLTKLTRTVNIDIWNFFHVILIAVFVNEVTGNTLISLLACIISYIMLLKLTEWVAPEINEQMGMEGICIPHISGIIHYPLALVGNLIIDKMPGLNKLEMDPERMQKKVGLLGEPMIIGFLLGLGLGISAGYEFKEVLTIAVRFAAVIFILPRMGGILGDSLIPISEGMKVFMEEKLPNVGQTYIGLDVAVLFSNPSTIVSALLLMPTSIILAIILPGINFIPLGDLTNLLVPLAFITIATKGNVIRSYIISIPVIIGSLYMANYFAPLMTKLAIASGEITQSEGLVTSFLDAGNLFRGWIILLFERNIIALALIPVVIGLLIYTWKNTEMQVRGKSE